jgi:hypothetical protein
MELESNDEIKVKPKKGYVENSEVGDSSRVESMEGYVVMVRTDFQQKVNDE